MDIMQSLIEDDKPKDVDSINVKLGHETGMFSIKQLKLLPYFESLLSPRWQQHHNGNNSNKTDTNDTIDVFGGSSPNFECCHLRLLLNFIETGHINCISIKNKSLTKMLYWIKIILKSYYIVVIILMVQMK